jgi:hypothetical protein
MGVFAWFSRKSRGSSGTVADGTAGQAAPEGAADDKAAGQPETAPAETSGSSTGQKLSGPAGPTAIPRQQSAGDAADSEAGESARQ